MKGPKKKKRPWTARNQPTEKRKKIIMEIVLLADMIGRELKQVLFCFFPNPVNLAFW